MKRSSNPKMFSAPLLCGVLVGLGCTLPAQPVAAEDEVRAGAVLVVPFSSSPSHLLFNPAKIRVGLTCQVANIKEDRVTITEYTHGKAKSTFSTTTARGDEVSGLEGSVFLEVFNNGNGAAELLGLYGNNVNQVAAGAGYSFTNGFFMGAKVMTPYSEKGVRLLDQVEKYSGRKVLGQFEPEKKTYQVTK